MECIKFNGVEKTLGNFNLKIDDLKIKKGFITGFVGPNGAGKTTTIKLIMNMLFPDKGEVTVDGIKVNNENNIIIKEKIGYVGVEPGFIEGNSIKTTVKVLKGFYKNWDDNKYKRFVKELNIDESKEIGDLSSGNKKLLQIAVALSTCPEIIIMDEPTANLDPIVRNQILEILQQEMENENTTIFYSTHITTDLDKAADYTIFILDGKIVLEDETDNILSEYVVIKGDRRFISNETKDGLIGIKENRFGFQALAKNKKKAFEIFGEEVVYDKATIEDVLLYLGGGRGNE
ncbi:MAG: ABC transporter ATP-binding protein [Clostridium sp.]